MKVASVVFPHCQKVLPLVYDDSLSYYESICKLVAKINEVIEQFDDWSDVIAELQEAITDIDSMKENITRLNNELTVLSERVDSNYTELVELVSQLDKLVKDSVKDMNNRVDTVEMSLSNLTQAIYNVNNHLQKEIDDLRVELTNLINSKYVNFEEELELLRLKVNQMKVNLQGQIDVINERLAELDTKVENPWHTELGKLSLDKNIKLMYNDLADCVPTAEEYNKLGLDADAYSSFGLRAIDYVLRGKERLHYYWVCSPAYGWWQNVNNVLTSILDFMYDVYSATAYSELDLTADEYSELDLTADGYYLWNYHGGGGGGDTRGFVKYDPIGTGLTRREYEHLEVSQT